MSNQSSGIWVNYERHRKLRFLAEPHRYKVLYGGRGGIKSWGMIRQHIVDAAEKPLKILCVRETMESIKESVHSLINEQISNLKLDAHFNVLKSEIQGINGSLFAFSGLRNVRNLKSYEGFDRADVEEAAIVSKGSWQTLIPTIRKAGSELWIRFNPELETDDTYQRFILHPPPEAVVVKTSWRDNPWLSPEFMADLEHLKATNLAEYNHVYEGLCTTTIEGAFFADELAKVDLEQRITRVPYEPLAGVHTWWDIGLDTTAIWFTQQVGFEFRIIDYYENAGLKLPHYLKMLAERPYTYKCHHLPHDAKAESLASERSVEKQIRVAYPDQVMLVPRLDVKDRVNAARTIFGQCWFDADKCADGIQALRHYRRSPTDNLGRDTGELHDWASHGGSAFCYFGVGGKVERPKPKSESKPAYVSAWS